jgi:glycine/D-amino acid oxidase-like deaminating enzyme
VIGIATRDGAIERVVTDRGDIRTTVAVDAAGAWTRVVADMTGIRVPIVPTRHQLYITRPIDGVAAEQPIVRVLDVNVYVRPERGGLMLGGYEPDPLQIDVNAQGADFQIKDLALDFEPLRKLTDEVRSEFPVLQNAEVGEFRGGLPTMTTMAPISSIGSLASVDSSLPAAAALVACPSHPQSVKCWRIGSWTASHRSIYRRYG